nr:MAG TPA: hypothetical protein [Caudoviricetes sp.]
MFYFFTHFISLFYQSLKFDFKKMSFLDYIILYYYQLVNSKFTKL